MTIADEPRQIRPRYTPWEALTQRQKLLDVVVILLAFCFFALPFLTNAVGEQSDTTCKPNWDYSVPCTNGQEKEVNGKEVIGGQGCFCEDTTNGNTTPGACVSADKCEATNPKGKPQSSTDGSGAPPQNPQSDTSASPYPQSEEDLFGQDYPPPTPPSGDEAPESPEPEPTASPPPTPPPDASAPAPQTDQGPSPAPSDAPVYDGSTGECVANCQTPPYVDDIQPIPTLPPTGGGENEPEVNSQPYISNTEGMVYNETTGQFEGSLPQQPTFVGPELPDNPLSPQVLNPDSIPSYNEGAPSYPYGPPDATFNQPQPSGSTVVSPEQALWNGIANTASQIGQSISQAAQSAYNFFFGAPAR
jgi:hypothetical protein